jgi:hypothetical protein
LIELAGFLLACTFSDSGTSFAGGMRLVCQSRGKSSQVTSITASRRVDLVPTRAFETIDLIRFLAAA